jgi:hypothetical protein
MIIYTVEIEWSGDFISSTQITRVIHVYIRSKSNGENILFFTKDFNSNNIKVKHDHSHC